MLLPRTIVFTVVGLLLQVASAEVIVPYPNRNTTWIVRAHHNVTWRTAGAGQQDPSLTSSLTANATSSTSISINATASDTTSTAMTSATSAGSSTAAANGTVTVTVFATANTTSSSARSDSKSEGTSIISTTSIAVSGGSSVAANTTGAATTATASAASSTSGAASSSSNPTGSDANNTMSTSTSTCTCTNQAIARRTNSDLSVEKIRLYTGNHISTEVLVWAGKVDFAAGRVEIQVPNVINGSDYSIGIITSDGQEVVVSDQFTIVSG
ncbi:uncharacterized protein TRAVEDRAFT_45578 [Trametes versicolor FP-101664 SS1]|uniref:uncharacterized protein n=1 Tax=Trametes versicolor (strain FP-101664) TaxID=717944 RepID=UPI0004622EA0|nr:uncharacterized protein TRAVEDRAFT_45578 [Trametes versicolor FP-101664 SS1]EIW60329.1 hypothetical protein TRAVEDRAFT_45578 [Trametes versicolor FP-101664 SS1]